MSVVIDYSLLSDPALTSSLVQAFNANLASAARPSFLGPITLNSFDFGTEEPDVEVVGLQDVYKDFLEAEEDDEEDEDEAHEGESGVESWTDEGRGRESGDGGWSRTGTDDEPLPQPTTKHRRDDSQYGGGLNIRGLASPPPSMGTRASFQGRPGFDFGSPIHHGSPFTSRVGLGSGLHSPIPTPYLSRNPSFSSLPPGMGPSPTPSTGSPHHRGHDREGHSRRPSPNEYPSNSSKPPPEDEEPSASGPPSLQLHLHIHHPSNIRISLSTTLLINHPSPAFMSLPLTLTITRLELDFHLVVAFEAASASNNAPAPNPSPSHISRQQPSSRRTRRRAPGNRVHISILDELDPYGPPTPSNPDSSPSSGLSGVNQDGKPVPIGQRIIPRMEIESGIGQEGEHVLRNVQKVERFVLELLRKTVVDELVFPNFQTLVV